MLFVINKDVTNKDKDAKRRFDELVNPKIVPIQPKRMPLPLPIKPSRKK